MLSFKLYIVRNLFYLIIYYNFMLTLQATIEMYVNCERCTVFLQLIKNDISIFIVSIEKMRKCLLPFVLKMNVLSTKKIEQRYTQNMSISFSNNGNSRYPQSHTIPFSQKRREHKSIDF